MFCRPAQKLRSREREQVPRMGGGIVVPEDQDDLLALEMNSEPEGRLTGTKVQGQKSWWWAHSCASKIIASEIPLRVRQ